MQVVVLPKLVTCSCPDRDHWAATLEVTLHSGRDGTKAGLEWLTTASSPQYHPETLSMAHASRPRAQWVSTAVSVLTAGQVGLTVYSHTPPVWPARLHSAALAVLSVCPFLLFPTLRIVAQYPSTADPLVPSPASQAVAENLVVRVLSRPMQ